MWSEAGWALCAAGLLLLLALHNYHRNAQVQVVAIPRREDPAPQIVIIRNTPNTRQNQPSTSSDPGNTDHTAETSNTAENPNQTNPESSGNTGNTRSGHPSASDSGYGHSRRDFAPCHSHSLESSSGSYSGTPTIDIIRNPLRNFTYPKIYQATQKVASEVRLNHPGIPKLPLPEEWLHKRPFNAKYTTIIRPLTQINPELGTDLHVQETKAKKLSATRSPSLEKDDKSPFLNSAKSVDSEVFGFDPESVKKIEAMNENVITPKETGDKTESPTSLRRYRSVSTRLNMCSVSETPENQEGIPEVSPKILECSSAKENSSSTKFQFSPKLLAETMVSPRFFTPPETVSPMFFAEPSPKSVYYDTVRSPKFFADTPREDIVPQSPRALGDHFNRNGVEKPTSKPSSPRVLSGKPSPKIHSYNKENYFTFEHAIVSEGSGNRVSPRPRKYGGRNSLERERFTPPADKELRKYRRHNSCDTNNKNVEINITKNDEIDNKITESHIEVSKKESADVVDCCAKMDALKIEDENIRSAQSRRHRLKSISLDSDNARIIEQNLGIPIAKQMKDQMNEAYKKDVSNSCESIERNQHSPTETQAFEFDESTCVDQNSPDIKRKGLRQSCDPQSFLDMPRFSPKEFEITITTEEGATMAADTQMKRKGKNLRNLTIDLTKRDSDLEKELQEFEKLYTDAEEKKVKTPTLKVKATSLDSSETVNLSLPQQKTLEVPQNSISVPNTPKRQLKRILVHKSAKPDMGGGKLGYSSIQGNERRLYMKAQDSGIFLRENHAALMLYQPGPSRTGSRTMGSFDENIADSVDIPPEINVSGVDNRSGYEPVHLGSNLLNYKQNLSVSSTNLKTLPEGVPSDDFEPSAEDEKLSKKLHRRNSNQSLLHSTHSLQSSNCSLTSSGTSCHNLVRTSVSNFSLSSESRKRLSLDRKDSHSSSTTTDHLTPTTRVICSSNTNVSETSKNCLLQRRGSNNSLTLNICPTNTLSRHSSNSSLNKETKTTQKKGLLERRSSNTSLTLNINTSNPQLTGNRPLSISNYNLNGSSCNLSRYNSNFSIDNATAEPKKGILERRSSNTSLTLNIPQEPRDLEIDETLIDPNLKELPNRDKHRKSLSTENLLPKSYINRNIQTNKGFGSHDNLWSSDYEQSQPQNLTYVGGDQENEIIYAFGSQDIENFQQGFVRNITTKPLSPQSTSDDFKMYLANMHLLQNASSVLTRQQLQDLNEVFQNGYSKVQCQTTTEGHHACPNKVVQDIISSPVLPQPCSEYQKTLLRNLHQEFWDMPTNFQEKPIVSGSHPKNRYKTILPNEHSRFILNADDGTSEGYINANFIKGHEYTKNSYIATQGPLQNTIYDFWLMVYQNNMNFYEQQGGDHNYSGVQKVVMLTNFIENNRQKCEKYFPVELNEEIRFDSPSYSESTMFFEEKDLIKNSFAIKNVGVVNKTGYTIRKLNVKYKRGIKSEQSDVESEQSGNGSEQSEIKSEQSELESEMTVHHYWFQNWADHKCPKDVNALLNLSLDILKDPVHNFDDKSTESENPCQCDSAKSAPSTFVFPPLESETTKCEMEVAEKKFSTLEFSHLDFNLDQSPPVIIHCSAGIGRTGCLIAILNGIKQLSNEQKVDVLGIVCNMRLNRGGMVQNSEQYELIHKVLCLFERVCLNL